ncbi:hypothetical protein [Oryzibacter oryziterrae]|uniref:hypothetical protein n=1 Tax=Oryzibacter oryziterrae TaxID=2766474 RepID=UPI001F1A397A|nr:hypothetical protein [Oryzibacter oryziterrae]
MTIEMHSGTLPPISSYANSVNAEPPSHNFMAAYTRYLRLRADAFDADLSKTDAEMYALVGSEARALAEAAAAPAYTIEEYGLKLQLLQS